MSLKIAGVNAKEGPRNKRGNTHRVLLLEEAQPLKIPWPPGCAGALARDQGEAIGEKPLGGALTYM